MVARVRVPAVVRPAEVFVVRIAIQHVMETGFRLTDTGRPIPRNIIHTLAVRYGGREVFRAELGSGVAANPYLEFHVRAQASGPMVFDWVDDAGVRGSETVAITVSG